MGQKMYLFDVKVNVVALEMLKSNLWILKIFLVIFERFRRKWIRFTVMYCCFNVEYWYWSSYVSFLCVLISAPEMSFSRVQNADFYGCVVDYSYYDTKVILLWNRLVSVVRSLVAITKILTRKSWFRY